jgi:hypothetical protein
MTCRLLGNIEAQTDNWSGQCCSYSREVMASTGPGVQDAPRPEHALGIGLRDVRDNRRGNGVKMACIEEFRPVSQLGRVVAARSRTASPMSQEIDVSLSGEIETVPIPADERTRRCR